MVRVLKNGLAEELEKILRGQWVSNVDIATAWATEGSALDALERKKSRATVRTLAGFSGNHTTPGALKRLNKLGKVRLVDGRAGLFHVKLYIFRGSRRSLGWVGSANFTGAGFGHNEELLYETDDTDELQEWFDARWKEVGKQPNQPEAYCKQWKPPAVPMPDHKPPPVAPSSKVGNAAAVIVFEQDEGQERPPPRVAGTNNRRMPPRGVVVIGEERHEYSSAQHCLTIVLDVLQQGDRDFLARCRDDPSFHRGESCYVGRRPRDLGPRKSFREYPQRLESGWLLSSQTQTQQKWELVLAAARIAGMSIRTGKRWRAEGGTSRVEVGF